VTRQRIWLLRHGESEWNAAGRWQGHGDPPLSERGREQAKRTAEAIAGRVRAAGRPVELFSSDLLRAAETADWVAAALDVTPTRFPALRELHVGRWSGLTRAEIEERDAELLAAFDTEDPDVRPGGGETRREIRARVRDAVERLALEHAEQDLLLVVHLGVIRVLVPGSEPANLELLETNLDQIRSAAEGSAETAEPAGPSLEL
jgi:broad specificity phosphatase PhoE